MQFKKLISVSKPILKAKLLKKKIPFVVVWLITERCNYKCQYCGLWRNPMQELDTEDVLRKISELSRLGGHIISFTGGEPLLREDIGEIIKYASRKYAFLKLNSNGALVVKKIDDLIPLNLLTMNLDGPKEVHDSIKGEGAYDRVIEAATAARSYDIRIAFNVTLSKLNLMYTDYILDVADRFDAKVVFQPATALILGRQEPNPIVPDECEYKRVLDRLIVQKSQNRNISNSISGLKHLRNWPTPVEIKCASGWLSCCVMPNGNVYSCARVSKNTTLLNVSNLQVQGGFENLPIVSCKECWCASEVELNKVFSLNIDAILNARKLR